MTRISVKEIREGICPLCGAEYKYGEREQLDDGGIYQWECPECGASGEEGFSQVFDGIYNVHDADGNLMELVPVKEAPSNAVVLRRYENFKLLWMKDHGHTLTNLLQELENMRQDNPDATIMELFNDWEYGVGFGGDIWPCLHEFLTCEEYLTPGLD